MDKRFVIVVALLFALIDKSKADELLGNYQFF